MYLLKGSMKQIIKFFLWISCEHDPVSGPFFIYSLCIFYNWTSIWKNYDTFLHPNVQIQVHNKTKIESK